MFGYRLIRESDYDELKAEVASLRATLLESHAASAEALLTVKAAAIETRIDAATKSKDTMIDMMSIRLNALEREAAHRRHAETGLAAIAPTIGVEGVGQPIRSAIEGAAPDLWDDMGDERVRQLRANGLIHPDDDRPIPPFEGAAEATAFLAEKES